MYTYEWIKKIMDILYECGMSEYWPKIYLD